MKAVILAGGYGTRISEETQRTPKPMIEIGGKPILWHILKLYSCHGINDFIICLGYKSYVIKEYFANYYLHTSDVTFNLRSNTITTHQNYAEPWSVTLVDTGLNTMTGGRLKRIKSFLDDEDFCFTYGDGLSNVDISAVINQHQQSDCLATVTAIQPPGRFGSIKHHDNKAHSFEEKPAGDGSWVNGGFFVLSSGAFDYITDDSTVWEQQPMQHLAKDGKMDVYFHDNFWHPMDTLRDKHNLEKLWNSGAPPWRKWSETTQPAATNREGLVTA